MRPTEKVEEEGKGARGKQKGGRRGMKVREVEAERRARRRGIGEKDGKEGKGRKEGKKGKDGTQGKKGKKIGRERIG